MLRIEFILLVAIVAAGTRMAPKPVRPRGFLRSRSGSCSASQLSPFRDFSRMGRRASAQKVAQGRKGRLRIVGSNNIENQR
jgi:hypothetical protein